MVNAIKKDHDVLAAVATAAGLFVGALSGVPLLTLVPAALVGFAFSLKGE